MTVFAALVPLLISGCAARGVGPAAEAAKVAEDKAVIEANWTAANAGEAQAQYRVGKAYCCAPGNVHGLYNNQKSTEWLCRAARQNFAPAQYKLAQMYADHEIDGPRVMRRVVLGVVGTDKDLALSTMWFTVAAQQDYKDAAKHRDSLTAKLSDAEIARSNAYLADWRSAPCEWEQVFGAH